MTKGIFLTILGKLKNKLSLLEIDFLAPWWRVVTNQKRYLVQALVGEVLYSAFRPLIILSFGIVFSSGRVDLFIYLFCVWAGIYIISTYSRLCSSMVQLQVIHSIHYRAHQWFLQVDPIYHTHRSSGTILGKIDRASRAYEDLLDALLHDMLQMVIGAATVVISLTFYSWWLGLMSSCLIILILFLNYIISHKFIIPYEKRLVRADDKVRAVSVENLAQINLIRTCFASGQGIDRLRSKDMKALRKEGGLWFLYIAFFAFVRFLYLINVCILGWYIFASISAGTMASSVGIALLLAYLRGTHEIIRIEKPMRNILKSVTRIKDLFKYMAVFGEQTFPVLQQVSSKCRMNLTPKYDGASIEINNISFDYSSTAKIFDGHFFHLKTGADQKNRLYGIIGPSGIGKSTFVSVLGGLLKPTSGMVFVNDINIYLVDDSSRKKILAIQGQVSSNVRGTLKYNLLFGLPRKKNIFSDEQLIDVLRKVGLWDLFGTKGGLDMFVGEGGFTLSGGQRQRLNFANLYLRATYYKPSVILIDEPTSSLDDISEQAITEMISSLAKNAITMVIAHRLKTVINAVGLIDFSLLEKEKEITIYSHEELKKRSLYYQKLITGNASL